MSENGSGLSWLVVGVLVAVMLGSSGCRFMGRLFGVEDASPRVGVEWVVEPPALMPPPPENRTVYVDWQDRTDGRQIDLTQDIKSVFTNAGYFVVDELEGTHFRVSATVRHYGENPLRDNGANLSVGIGPVEGAANAEASVDFPTDAPMREEERNLWRVKEYLLIVDLIIEEYAEDGFDLTADATASTGADEAEGSARVSYYPHGTRMAAWARQIALQEEEAVPLLQEAVSDAILDFMP